MDGMRIISGRFKGVPLGAAKSGTRPTTDRTKEAIFSRLEAWGTLRDAHVLDLYAGTGALGFEALSRGARSATFVESSGPAAQLIAQTAATVKSQQAWEPGRDDIHVVKAKAERFVDKRGGKGGAAGPFDVVLIDPPYAVPTRDCEALLAGLVDGGMLGSYPLVMLERSTRSAAPKPPRGWEIADRRDYGETAVYYLRPEREEE